MNSPSPEAWIEYSGQWWRRLFNACELIERAPSLSAVLRKTRIERHAAVDEQRGPVDVIGIVGGEPDRSACNVDGLTDSLIGYKRHQLRISLSGLPGRGIDRGADRPRCDAVDANATRSNLLCEALHQQHHAAFRRCVIRVTCPGNELVDRAHEYDLACGAGNLGKDAAIEEMPNRFPSAQE